MVALHHHLAAVRALREGRHGARLHGTARGQPVQMRRRRVLSAQQSASLWRRAGDSQAAHQRELQYWLLVRVLCAHSEATVVWDLFQYGPWYREGLVPRRHFLSSVVHVLHPWDVPMDLLERCSKVSDLPVVDQASHAEHDALSIVIVFSALP